MRDGSIFLSEQVIMQADEMSLHLPALACASDRLYTVLIVLTEQQVV